MGDQSTDEVVALSRRDRTLIAAQAILRGIPYIGPSIEHLMFGVAAERRWQRVEQTLREIAEKLEKRSTDHNVASEEYTSLLEDSMPALARSINEDKRVRFRDLLLNAATVPSGSRRWDEATLARQLLEAIDPPGLAILAALARHQNMKTGQVGATADINVQFLGLPFPRFVSSDVDSDTAVTVNDDEAQYDWVVLEEWMRRLRGMRLVIYNSGGAKSFGGVYLTDLGNLLINWIIEKSDQR